MPRPRSDADGAAAHEPTPAHEPKPAPAPPLDARQRAEAVGRAMLDDDRATRHLGIELLEIGPGQARMRMRVRREFTNGHGICHGGYIFLLADSTFAFACNSHNQRAVAAGCSIEFIAPAQEGDVLTAEGVQLHQGKRSGLYDMRVTNQDGKLIALFRGKSASIPGRFFEEAS